jgi:hypothetical protein
MARRDQEEPGISGFIRHRDSEQYYRGNGEWTGEVRLAKVFDSFADVVAEADKYQIKDCCEFVVQFGERKEMNLFLPI